MGLFIDFMPVFTTLVIHSLNYFRNLKVVEPSVSMTSNHLFWSEEIDFTIRSSNERSAMVEVHLEQSYRLMMIQDTASEAET